MARKAVVSGGTRDEIIAVAKGLFFEKGFDGVTIRSIQREVGCEVGLFYYYFESKDKVFDVVMEQLQAEWDSELRAVVDDAEDSYREQLEAILDCMRMQMKKFTDGSKVLHWSVRGALCHRLSTVAAAYIRELLKRTGVRIWASAETLSVILAGGMGELLYESSDRDYDKNKEEIIRLVEAVIPEYRGRSKELSVELL